MRSRRDPEPTRFPALVSLCTRCEVWILGTKMIRERIPDHLQIKPTPSCWWKGICEKLSCDWHIATPGIKSPFSLLFSFSVVNFHPFSFLFVAPFQDDYWVPLYPQAGGEEGLALSSMGLTIACSSFFKAEVWCYLKTFI